MTAGCDVVDITRFAAVLARRTGFVDRVFTSIEQDDALRGDVEAGSATHVARLAARFAAKEAARKALGDLRLPFRATEVRTSHDGSPRLFVDGLPAPFDLSLSHDGDVAMAFVTRRRRPSYLAHL